MRNITFQFVFVDNPYVPISIFPIADIVLVVDVPNVAKGQLLIFDSVIQPQSEKYPNDF